MCRGAVGGTAVLAAGTAELCWLEPAAATGDAGGEGERRVQLQLQGCFLVLREKQRLVSGHTEVVLPGRGCR